MKNRRQVAAALVLLLVTPTGALAAKDDTSANAGECSGDGLACGDKTNEDLEYEIDTKIQVYSDQGLDNGGATELICADGQVRLIRDATLAGAPTGTGLYSGGTCVPSGTYSEGIERLTSADFQAELDLPVPAVNHSPHAEFFIVNFPTWFWHEGPTTHTQTVTVDLDNGGTITGTYTGRITKYCWTIDDPRELPEPDQTHNPERRCPQPAKATTYTSDTPGEDSETGAAATHTYTYRGYDSRITHTTVWTGTVTITDGDGLLPIGQELVLAPSIVRVQKTVPIKQIVPVLIPNPD